MPITFSEKNAFDDVFSGHRRKHDGAPAVTVDDYREIFTTDSSIPVLDLSTLEEASSGLNMEIWSTKPDYDIIFGGFVIRILRFVTKKWLLEMKLGELCRNRRKGRWWKSGG
ncbi:hypothetical protein Hdeb2414_s0008g00283891 [Helianthus debilis subsp. tardiflorus]